MPDEKNIVLIGMPTSGKSTVGVIVAKMLGMDFIDTDIVLQKREGHKLREIIEKQGIEAFLNKEERAVLGITAKHSVIATGGSVVYSETAMKHLSENATILYLKIELPELKKPCFDLEGYHLEILDLSAEKRQRWIRWRKRPEE